MLLPVLVARHRENGRIRVLMRQEKTMKVIANHVVDPRINMTPNVGSDKSWVWTAFDFSEGDLKEVRLVAGLP
jgi:Ran-binding protein 1